MLIKILGALIIILSLGFLGQKLANILLQQKQALKNAQQGLQALATAIDYSLVPLPQALAEAGNQAGGSVGECFYQTSKKLTSGLGLTAQEAWQETLIAEKNNLPLNQEDWEILQSCGVGLGLSHREDQLKRLALAKEKLAKRESEAAERAAKMGKIYKSMGWGCGLIVALLWF